MVFKNKVRSLTPALRQSPLERGTIEGDSPVCGVPIELRVLWALFYKKKMVWSRVRSLQSRTAWECSPNAGGSFHPRLNIGKSPIAHKYREGRMQRTLKKESKVLEIVERETIETSCSRSLWTQPA